MILLEKLDLAARFAVFRTLGTTRGHALVAVDRLRGGLLQLGIDRLVVRFETGRPLEVPCALSAEAASIDAAERPYGTAVARPSPEGAATPGTATQTRTPDPGPQPPSGVERQRSLVHRLELEDGKPTYVARFPHRPESLETIAVYSGVVLSTFGPLTGALHSVRLALYELCANAVEHGRPLAAGVEVELGIGVDNDRIVGWVRDRCEAFDPSAKPLPTLAEHAAEGARRGYGLHMVHRILTSMNHDFDGTGNRVTFRKEIA